MNLNFWTKKHSSSAHAGILGFIIGDALGVPVEFKPRGEFPPIQQMTGFGTHNQPPGTWSDDSSMTLCTLDSLTRHGYDLVNLKKQFCDWAYWGHWTHNGSLPFDIGHTTSRTLTRIKAGIAKEESGETDEKSNGNGSLMRILPLAFVDLDQSFVPFDRVEAVSAITHAHPRSLLACDYYVQFAVHLLRGESILSAYVKTNETIQQYISESPKFANEKLHFQRIFSGKLGQLTCNDIENSGYVIHTLEAALWCLLTTSSYTDAVLAAVNLGDDTDTAGAITGGLAGIYYGYDSLPKKWITQLARQKDIISLLDSFQQRNLQKGTPG